MKTKKIVALLCIIAVGSFNSCKKKTSDPEPDATTPVTPVNQLCDGVASNSFYPLDSLNNWTYVLKYSSSIQSVRPSPKVERFVTYNSKKYAEIKDGSIYFTDAYIREDAVTHNVYRYKSSNSTEYLEIPGTPTLNQTWPSGYGTTLTVTNLSASKNTTKCTYTGLLEITDVNTQAGITQKLYYKKGLGLVSRISVSGSSSDLALDVVILK